MGCTEAELLRCLPQAMGAWPWHQDGARVQAQAPEGGTLTLTWEPLPPRCLGLAVIPRLGVTFRFDGVPTEARTRWLAHFDLYTRRGGG